LKPAHQDVGYFQFAGEAPPITVGDFPVWVYAGAQGLAGDDTFYGLPEFRRAGVKLARHRTGGHADDPDRTLSKDLPPEVKADLEEFARAQFSFPVSYSGYDPCLYTNTAHEDFLLDHYPGDRRVVIASACSGHGFKFGPLTGRIIAGLLLDGKTDVPSFERHRTEFAWSAMPVWGA
jgi:sarcosine oxidase